MSDYQRYLSERLAAWPAGEPEQRTVRAFLEWVRADEETKAVRPVFESAKVSMRASRSSWGVEVELDDGVMHLRVDMDDQAAGGLLEAVDQVMKGFERERRIDVADGALELWAMNGARDTARYGIRLVAGDVSVVGRVGAPALDAFADQLEEMLD